MVRIAVALLLLIVLRWVAHAEKRVALVIGNANYRDAGVLANPANDARDIAAAFRRIDVEVDTLVDGDLSGMRAALEVFAGKASGADLAIIYYSGHGLEINSINYLLPVDVKLAEEADVAKEAMPLDRLISTLGMPGKMKMIILDACRNN